MSVVAKIIIEGHDEPLISKDVTPGDQTVLLSYDGDGNQEYLSVGCAISDFGGSLHRFSEDEVEVLGEHLVVHSSLFDDEHEIASFGIGEGCAQPVKDEKGTEAVLVIRHVGAWATLMSQN